MDSILLNGEILADAILKPVERLLTYRDSALSKVASIVKR